MTPADNEALSPERVAHLREKAIHQSIFADMRADSETTLALISEREAVRSGLEELLAYIEGPLAISDPTRMGLLGRVRRLLGETP